MHCSRCGDRTCWGDEDCRLAPQPSRRTIYRAAALAGLVSSGDDLRGVEQLASEIGDRMLAILPTERRGG